MRGSVLESTTKKSDFSQKFRAKKLAIRQNPFDETRKEQRPGTRLDLGHAAAVQSSIEIHC